MRGVWRKTGILALVLVLASPSSQAFTLVISSGLKGWDASILPIHYNPSGCGDLAQADLESAIDAAVALWNSVPMSSIRLKRGRISTSSASDFNADPIAIYDSPVILCSPTFGVDSGLDPSLSLGIEEIVPALTRPAALDGRLVFAPMLLNSAVGAAANIANFTQEKRTIIIAHEIGHMLGLGHVSDPASLMFFNVSDKGLLALSRDDAEGVTYLYPRQEPFAGEFMGCGTVAAISGRSGGPGGDSGTGNDGGTAPLSWMALFMACFVMSRLRFSRLSLSSAASPQAPGPLEAGAWR
jgi:hypothetical protein